MGKKGKRCIKTRKPMAHHDQQHTVSRSPRGVVYTSKNSTNFNELKEIHAYHIIVKLTKVRENFEIGKGKIIIFKFQYD